MAEKCHTPGRRTAFCHPAKSRDLGCDSLPKCSPSKFCAPARVRRQFRGDGLPGRSLPVLHLPVIARQRRCRGNPIECCDLTTISSDSHAHFRSLGMTSPTHARRTCRIRRGVFDYRGADFVITQFVPDGTYRSISRSGRTRQGERHP